MANWQLWDRLLVYAETQPARLSYEEAGGKNISYEELVGRSRAIAAAVSVRLPAGSVVVLRCGNECHFAPWLIGLLRAGLNVLPIAPEATENELLGHITSTRAQAMVTDDELLPDVDRQVRFRWRLDDVDDDQALYRFGFDDQKDHSVLGEGVRDDPLDRPPGDLLLVSSGTTGRPKIVRRTARSLDAVASVMADTIGFRTDEKVLAAVPLTHSYGLEHGLLAPLWAGSGVALTQGLSLPQVLAALAGGVTLFPAVPSMLEMLIGLADRPAVPSLRLVYTAGAPLPSGVRRSFFTRFGLVPGQIYGMTEIGSVCYQNPDDAAEKTPLTDAGKPSALLAATDTSESVDATESKTNAIGRPFVGVSTRIVDISDSRKTISVGETGQVAIKADWMFDGYINEAADLIEGHFLTGDIGRMDADGRLFLTGRMKLMIDVGGAKVNPAEVEEVLLQHEGVRDCVVVPISMSRTIDKVAAVVVASDPARPPTAAELRDLARRHLAAYKVPRLIHFRSSLPRTSAGKIARQELIKEIGSCS